MNVLKGLGTALLSLLLFLCLNILGVAVLVNATVLNADFITGQIHKLDVSETAREIIDEYLELDIPAEVPIPREVIEDLVYEIIDEYEPWLGEQIDHVIESAYAYLHGGREDLSISVSLVEVKSTIRDKLWNAASEQFETVVPDIIGDDLSGFIDQNLAAYIDEIPADLLPADVASMPGELLEEYLNQFLEDMDTQIAVQEVVPQLSGLLEEIVRPMFDEAIDEFIGGIDDVYIIDEELIGPETMSAIEEVRTYLGYFKSGYYGLIGLIVLLAAGIFLINRNVKGTTRPIGITMIFYGGLQLAGIIIARSVNLVGQLPDEIPAVLESWILSVYQDTLLPSLWFSAGVLAVGVVLVVMSFIFSSQKAPARPE